jgi:glycopeptide antibiotics resistance protein
LRKAQNAGNKTAMKAVDTSAEFALCAKRHTLSIIFLTYLIYLIYHIFLLFILSPNPASFPGGQSGEQHVAPFALRRHCAPS